MGRPGPRVGRSRQAGLPTRSTRLNGSSGSDDRTSMPRSRARAFRVEYNGFRFYTAVVSGRELLRASIVSRRADTSEGFNRALSKPRAREIARYLDTENSSIPTSYFPRSMGRVSLFIVGILSGRGCTELFLY
jgi:hypothetical protein